MTKAKYILTITVLSIITVALAISLPGTFSSGPCSPDGQRYSFNGVLLHDMIRDGDFLNPYQYNVKFYAHYPATNLPYGPPFFALVFAGAFSLFGISFAVARGVVALYTVGAALMCWYLVYKTSKRYWLSILSVTAFLANPIVGICSRDIGPELAIALHSFLTLYFFYHYVEGEKKYFAICSALSLGLGYLSKPYILPLALALPVYVLIRKKWSLLFKTETWLALFAVSLLTIPYSILTFKFSGEELGFKTLPPVSWSLLLGYPKLIMRHIPILAFLATLGFAIGISRKNHFICLCFLWTVFWYGFNTFYMGYLIHERYLLSLVLALLFPFTLAFDRLSSLLKKVHLDKIFIGLFILWIGYTTFSAPVYYVRGYEDAGRYIAEHSQGKSVLFYSRYDGSFMMGVRERISRNGPYILEGRPAVSGKTLV